MCDGERNVRRRLDVVQQVPTDVVQYVPPDMVQEVPTNAVQHVPTDVVPEVPVIDLVQEVPTDVALEAVPIGGVQEVSVEEVPIRVISAVVADEEEITEVFGPGIVGGHGQLDDDSDSDIEAMRRIVRNNDPDFLQLVALYQMS